MSDARRGDAVLTESFRRHVLAPVEAAESITEREHAELTAERRAFERFKERVAAVETVSGTATVPKTRRRLDDDRSRALDRIRNAFHETVMSVDHYDDVYGESFDEHFAAELSDELLGGIRNDSSSAFTHVHKRALMITTEGAIEKRETFCSLLKNELESLETSENTLAELISKLDGTRVPVGLRADFTDTLDELARQRQNTLDNRTSSPYTDGRDLCLYLYTNCSWSFPVLTAVTRIRGTFNGVTT